MIAALAMIAVIAVTPAGLKACATPITAGLKACATYMGDVAQGFSPADDLSSPKLRIAWSEFKKLYDDGKVLVVDVRDAGAFAAGHIPKARLIPLEDVESRARELKKQKLPVVTYCS